MRNIFIVPVLLTLVLTMESCRPPEKESEGDDRLHGNINDMSHIQFDSSVVANFFTTHPRLEKYQNTVVAVYRRHQFNRIWFDSNGIIEFGSSLYNKMKGLKEEGITATFPYQEQLDDIFIDDGENVLSPEETDVLLTSTFLFYAEKVVKGVDERSSSAMGWLLPRKKVSYSALLKSLMTEPELLKKDERSLLAQYYKLRDALKRYREIESRGGWRMIEPDSTAKAYSPGDSAKALLQIRERLFMTGDLRRNNESAVFDKELAAGMKKYLRRNGFNHEDAILPKHIRDMNIPVGKRIKTILVNMERCRWISPEISKAKEFVVVNIPAYTLNLFRNGKNEFESPVVVGASMSKTVIFSGEMSYIVFSPYWYLPKSIIAKEVRPGMAKDSNYLESRNMEWNNGLVRQRPGGDNSLGLVKFMFPNSNDIYLHDSPAKNLYQKESRAFSHGCIRVAKPKELAVTILKNDTAWTPEKIDSTMHGGKEITVMLKQKIPVFIGYFTAWVNDRGEVNFYGDVYKRDKRLLDILMN
ncbi:MAG: L,D-transpeptidase family protein [Bacteroidota bacterium]